MSSIKEFQHLQIPLEDIKVATNNFGNDNCIGRGGFGKVYGGQLLVCGKYTPVAIKRLDTTYGQGAPEFWKEIMMLSRYKHENLVSLIGFCDERGECILVYEYLPNKSLDLYLSSSNLSWMQRLHICIGAARGLQYLHDPGETQQRALHRDIKSANILLDQDWNAKIADLGLSRIGPANQQFTFLVSNAVGTMGYCDPLYHETGYLTKESDIYSFGVVLFEVLCGRLGVQDHEDYRRFLAILAQRCYEENKLDTIILGSLKEQISKECLDKFTELAFQCLQRDREKRPSMSKVVNELEIALQHEVDREEMRLDREEMMLDCEERPLMVEVKEKLGSALESLSKEEHQQVTELKLAQGNGYIMKMLTPRRISETKKKLMLYLLHKGILFDNDNRFFSIKDDGMESELMSPKTFLYPSSKKFEWEKRSNFRFSEVARFPYKEQLRIHCRISASMLCSGIMYAANLVFSFEREPQITDRKSHWMTIKWQCEELNVSSTHCAQQTDEGWMKIRLWHFVNTNKNANFDIVLHKISRVHGKALPDDIFIHGIEFHSIDMVEAHNGIENIQGISISEEDVNSEKKMPSDDCEGIIQRSDTHLEYTTQQELYLLLCDGILIDDGRKWFSLCQSTGGKCHMLPALDVLHVTDTGSSISQTRMPHWTVLSLSESSLNIQYMMGPKPNCSKIVSNLTLYITRFKEVVQLGAETIYSIQCTIESNMVSPGNIYACYLVFRFAEDHIWHDDRRAATAWRISETASISILSAHLNSREPINIPTIMPKNDKGSQEMSNVSSIFDDQGKEFMDDSSHNWMEQRNDGWMEVMLCNSLHKLEDHKEIFFYLTSAESGLYGIIVEGVEFRPVQKLHRNCIVASSYLHRNCIVDSSYLHRLHPNCIVSSSDIASPSSDIHRILMVIISDIHRMFIGYALPSSNIHRIFMAVTGVGDPVGLVALMSKRKDRSAFALPPSTPQENVVGAGTVGDREGGGKQLVVPFLTLIITTAIAIAISFL
ncbi:hypothetical protein OSB04_020862 [Centaurea solstitialis]|uniref:non-specific serine/threonine protein kinase n=1 Tax=Centaurea solstitialis TaxID=347529 RepID=A0AA38SUQ5_9ASTR|nr:hypothetical protein OSB04_020862 [Centaurea solstitialis]